MKNILICVFVFVTLTSLGEGKVDKVSKPNILFITLDDMNDWTTVFDKSNPIRIPNIEKLADRGVFFTRAYCSSPACNPSRASVMTGTRPNKTGIYGNNSDWRSALPKIKTIQRYFKENGYFVCGSGKIFHHHRDWAFHDNASFHEYLMMSINEPYPAGDIRMPGILSNDIDDIPKGAKDLVKSTNWFWEGMQKALNEDPDAYRDYVRSYQACASFADEMIGKIIHALDKSKYRDNTIFIQKDGAIFSRQMEPRNYMTMKMMTMNGLM